jgi:serine/threonine-protein kinase
MAPEQAFAERIDARCDLFAAGAVLYAMLTTRGPFEADGPAQMLERLRADDPVPIESARPDVPAALREFLRIALRKDPSQRYQSAAQMREALLACMSECHYSASSDAVAAAAKKALAPTQGGSAVKPTPVRQSRLSTLRWGLAGVLAVSGAVVAWRITHAKGEKGVSAAKPSLAAPPSPSVTTTPSAAAAPAATAPASKSPPPQRTAMTPVKSRPAGVLDVFAQPWADVQIDGEKRGRTPLVGLRVSEGKHMVRLSNAVLGTVRTRPITVTAGQKVVVRNEMETADDLFQTQWR